MRANDYPSLDFDLGETADMIRDTVRAFTADKIAPRAAEIDRPELLLGGAALLASGAVLAIAALVWAVSLLGRPSLL